MVDHGLIDNAERGIWQPTPAGRQWYQVNWRGPQAGYANVVQPGLIAKLSKADPTRSDRTGTVATVDSRHLTPRASSTGDAKTMQRLVTRALAELDRTQLSGLDQYLIAIVSYELGRHNDALRLLDTALAGGLDGDYRVKAERLREICVLKAGV